MTQFRYPINPDEKNEFTECSHCHKSLVGPKIRADERKYHKPMTHYSLLVPDYEAGFGYPTALICPFCKNETKLFKS